MKYLIGAAVGSVIGYITNWLAIKMLFKPHKEHKIAGVRVLFTPGLIPKEKPRIAKSVGETIGAHLLTKETILESLCSDNMNAQLDLWVKDKVSQIDNSEITLADELKQLLGQDYYKLLQHIENKISYAVIDNLKKEEAKIAINDFLLEKVVEELKVSPSVLLESNTYREIKQNLLSKANSYKNSEEFSTKLEELLKEQINSLENCDKTLEEVIPNALISSLKVYVYNKKYEISMEINDLLKQDKNREKIRSVIAKTISTNLSPMIAMFLNADSINEKVIKGIDDFLKEEENQVDVAVAINEIIDKLLKNKVSAVLVEMPKEGIDSAIKAVVKTITVNAINEELIEEFFNNIEGNLKDNNSIDSILNKFNIDYKNILNKFIKEKLDTAVESDEFHKKTSEFISLSINRFMQMQINEMFTEDKDKISQVISNVVKDLYNKFIENKASDVVDILNVSRIVEDKINEFDVDFAEKIIIEIANKELSAITWLGALLGAIMGLLGPIINSFY